MVANVCGLLIMIPPRYFRFFHLDHHRHTQDPVRDPELAGADADSRLAYLWRVSGIPYWLERTGTTWRHAKGNVDEGFVPVRQRRVVVKEARHFIAAYAVMAAVSIFQATDVLFWYWLVPVLIGQPVLRLYLMAEHGGCPNVPDMLANSRTTTSNPMVRFFAWNMPYHAEHHSYPTVPFHRLPDLHQLTKVHLGATSESYRSFHKDYLGSLENLHGTG